MVNVGQNMTVCHKDYTILYDHRNCPLASSTTGLLMKSVQAEISHKYDRKIMPKFESTLDALWTAKTVENPNIYNGSKFRLHHLTYTSDSICLKFGITCYKDFQCTNMQPQETLNLLKEYGSRIYEDCYACMANPMFSTVLVESSDGYAVLFKRSNMVGEAPGMIDFPGGHMEPSEVDEKENVENMKSESVVKEFYYSALREVRDEVNLPEFSLSWPCLLGIVRNNLIGGKPGACFYISCSCTSEEIKHFYQQGGPESFESTEIILMKMNELFDENSTKLMELSKNMPIAAHAVYQLYKPFYQERINKTAKTEAHSRE